MNEPNQQRLMVLTPALGVVSETFIERHCTDLAPGAVSFGAFAEERSSAAWAPEVTSLLPLSPKPQPRTLSKVADRLRPRPRRHAHRSVWWVADEAVTSIMEHVERHQVTCALLEYLDRWLNVIPMLVDASVRVVVHGHGYDLSSSLRNPATVAAYRQLLPHANAVVVPSRFAAERLTAHGIPRPTVIPYGILIPPLIERPRRTEGPVRLVAVGRLVAKKDPVGLVRAVDQARALGADLHLDLIGDGPLRSAVAAAIRERSLSQIVSSHGALDNRSALDAMRAADVFVQRSVVAHGGDEEGLPLAILEAMASGLPIVSTRHAGIPEAVVDGVTGLLCHEDDEAGLAAAIARYCSEPDLRVAHGQAGRRRVQEQFSWSRNQARLQDLLGLPVTSPFSA